MDYLISLLISIPCVLVALVFHEVAHGFIAYKLGDPTARYMGRLSLNPLKHLDPIGTLCMVFFRFGWAKPVPIDVRYFKKPRRDIALSSLAGPVANLILALVGALLYSLCLALTYKVLPEYESFLYYVFYALLMLFTSFTWLNISLAIFNLIPLPPLDGSRIFLIWLPYRVYAKIVRYERQISLAFMAILIIDSRLLDGYFIGALSFVVNFIFNGMLSLFTFLY